MGALAMSAASAATPAVKHLLILLLLFAFELSRAFFQKSRYAFLLVFGPVYRRHEKSLEFDARSEIHLHPAVHRALREREAERRALGVDVDERFRAFERAAFRRETVDEADSM